MCCSLIYCLVIYRQWKAPDCTNQLLCVIKGGLSKTIFFLFKYFLKFCLSCAPQKHLDGIFRNFAVIYSVIAIYCVQNYGAKAEVFQVLLGSLL